MNVIVLLKTFIHIACLLPIIWLYWQAVQDSLGADPVKAVIHFTGMGTLNLLLLSLTVSPLAKRKGWGKLMNVRRLLGLYASVYGLLHLVNFIAFDLQFDVSLIVKEIIKRPYITVGMLSFLILLGLAITSPNSVKRKMGSHWQKLHNLTYVLIILAILHFCWSLKVLTFEAYFYITLTVFLLWLRRKRLMRLCFHLK